MTIAKRKIRESDPEVTAALRDTISSDPVKSTKARQLFAKAMEGEIRKTFLSGGIYADIVTINQVAPNERPMYMLDWIVPGTEADYIAYTVPAQGAIPRKIVHADYVEVPTYETGASLDWNRRMSQVAGAGFMGKAQDRLMKMFEKKINDDVFHAVLMAIVDRNIVIYDAAALANQFTKRVVSLGQLVMRRNTGGNSVTNNARLTDIWQSLEAHEDVRNWGLDIIDDFTRRDIFNAPDGLMDVFGTRLRPIFELGVNQEYQNYYTVDLGGTLPASDTELMIGMNLDVEDGVVMPVEEMPEVLFDNERRARLEGIFAFARYGVAVLDNRICLGLSL